VRLRHYSLRTEEAYVGWIRGYILFHGKRHPGELDERHVSEFLSSLAINGRVAASTQNQALNALLFLYKEVLQHELGFVGSALPVKRPPKVPVVLSPAEVRAVLSHLDGQYRLMAQLLYGSGLRLLECLRLRVKDVDLEYLHITVRDPKGGRERKTMLPVSLAAPLREHLEKVKARHEQDLAKGFGSVHLPGALERKMSSASREWAWQYVFPAERRSIDPRTGFERRVILRLAQAKSGATSVLASFVSFPTNDVHRGMHFHFGRAQFPSVIARTDAPGRRRERCNRQ
jgi:integron integrase